MNITVTGGNVATVIGVTSNESFLVDESADGLVELLYISVTRLQLSLTY